MVDDFEQALAELGVNENSLQRHERQALNDAGYAILAGVLSANQLEEYRELFDRAVTEQAPSGSASQKETGTRHIKNLHLIEPLWRVAIHPRILAAAFHVLNRRFVPAFPHGREPLPGFGEQGLHMDWRSAANGDTYYVATAICLLDDFTASNGATRLVPGSHRNVELPNRKTADPGFVHPRQTVVTAPAGSVLFFNGHVLHSGTRNRSQLRRRTLQMSFTAYEVRGWVFFEGEEPASLSNASRYVFGFS